MKKKALDMEKPNELKDLLEWAKRMNKYMGIAIRDSDNPGLAEIAIDLHDQMAINKIITHLQQEAKDSRKEEKNARTEAVSVLRTQGEDYYWNGFRDNWDILFSVSQPDEVYEH